MSRIYSQESLDGLLIKRKALLIASSDEIIAFEEKSRTISRWSGHTIIGMTQYRDHLAAVVSGGVRDPREGWIEAWGSALSIVWHQGRYFGLHNGSWYEGANKLPAKDIASDGDRLVSTMRDTIGEELLVYDNTDTARTGTSRIVFGLPHAQGTPLAVNGEEIFMGVKEDQAVRIHDNEADPIPVPADQWLAQLAHDGERLYGHFNAKRGSNHTVRVWDEGSWRVVYNSPRINAIATVDKSVLANIPERFA